MYSIWQTHKRKITALILILIPLVMLSTSAGAQVGQSTSAPARFGMSAITWLQSGTHSLVASSFGVVASLFQSDEDREIDELEAEVARLREEKTRLIGVLQENERLRRMAGFKVRRPELELVPARVIARDITPYFRVLKLKIDAGDIELEPRMPVVVADGVVGQIHRVYGAFADVLVVSDPRHRIDALAQRTRAQAIVEGLGHEADYNARLAYLREKDEVRVGDVMVTSGMDQVFPPELVIGTVREVERNDRDLFQTAIIEPAVDMGRIEEVFVIVGTK